MFTGFRTLLEVQTQDVCLGSLSGIATNILPEDGDWRIGALLEEELIEREHMEMVTEPG